MNIWKNKNNVIIKNSKKYNYLFSEATEENKKWKRMENYTIYIV